MEFNKDFNQCPNCGSESRFMEAMGKELVERNLAPDKWKQAYDFKAGVVSEPNHTPLRLLAGAKLPAYTIVTDICTECGTVYAVKLDRKDVPVQIQQPKLNRVDRRRLLPPNSN